MTLANRLPVVTFCSNLCFPIHIAMKSRHEIVLGNTEIQDINIKKNSFVGL